jgi:hypothetical protein
LAHDRWLAEGLLSGRFLIQSELDDVVCLYTEVCGSFLIYRRDDGYEAPVKGPSCWSGIQGHSGETSRAVRVSRAIPFKGKGTNQGGSDQNLDPLPETGVDSKEGVS